MRPRPSVPLALIAFVGLPGTGKSSLAAATGAATGFPVVSMDMVLATAGGLLTPHPAGLYAAADVVLTNIADRHLDAGQSVILDSIAAEAETRDEWREMAAIYDAAFRIVQCVCTDAALHRARLVARARHPPERSDAIWTQIARMRDTYAPWGPDALIADAAQPFAANYRAVVEHVGVTRSE